MIPWLSVLAYGHGPPAAVLGVASADEAGPVHVRLTEGMAVRDGDGFLYVCPTRWGAVPLAPFAAGDADGVLVPGADDVYRVDRAGDVFATGDPAHAVGGLLDLDGSAGVWAIYTGDEEREIARLDTSLTLGGGEPPWSGVHGSADGADLVAAVNGAVLHRTINGAGGTMSETSGPSLLGTGPQLVDDGTQLWVIDRASGYVGVRALSGGAPVAEAVDSTAGPLRVDDDIWVALDGLLYALTPGGPVRTPEMETVTCLDGQAGAWACAGDLYALAVDGTLGETVLSLVDLRPPRVDALSEDDAVACWGEWRTFALDLGLEPGDLPADDTPTVVIATGRCDAKGGPGAVAGLGAVVAFLLTRRGRHGTVQEPARAGEAPRATSSTAREQRGTRRGAGGLPE